MVLSGKFTFTRNFFYAYVIYAYVKKLRVNVNFTLRVEKFTRKRTFDSDLRVTAALSACSNHFLCRHRLSNVSLNWHVSPSIYMCGDRGGDCTDMHFAFCIPDDFLLERAHFGVG